MVFSILLKVISVCIEPMVSGCSSPSVLFLDSITYSVSCNASCRRPTSLYLMARLCIEQRVSGYSSPNAVTFIVATEVYPTPIRATAHGFSATCGKLGALTAVVVYNYIDTQKKFYVVS